MARYLGFEPTDTKPYYFLSYNSEDYHRVGEYGVMLHNAGMPIWYDQSIKYGSDWEQTIVEHIENCQCVIMFISKGIFGKNDSYVFKEYKLAKEHFDKKIIVINLDRISNKDVPNRYKSWWIDLEKLDNVHAYDFPSHIECVKEIIKGTEFSPAEAQYDAGNANTIVFDNGDRYTGQSEFGAPHGEGVMYYANGDVFEGQFVLGAKFDGTLTYADGSVYKGMFWDDEPMK